MAQVFLWPDQTVPLEGGNRLLGLCPMPYAFPNPKSAIEKCLVPTCPEPVEGVPSNLPTSDLRTPISVFCPPTLSPMPLEVEPFPLHLRPQYCNLIIRQEFP